METVDYAALHIGIRNALFIAVPFWVAVIVLIVVLGG